MFLKQLATIRTNNFQDPSCIDKIQRLWKEQEKEVAAAFAAVQAFYAVYHDYASDFKGDYSLSLCKLTDQDAADFVLVDEGYEVFEVDQTDPQGVLHTWQEIWQAERSPSTQETIQRG